MFVGLPARTNAGRVSEPAKWGRRLAADHDASLQKARYQQRLTANNDNHRPELGRSSSQVWAVRLATFVRNTLHFN